MALITSTTNLDYLIDPLRVHLGDFTVPYTYTDNELRTRIVYAVKTLMNRWNNKYLINNTTNNVSRNGNWKYLLASPPIIQHNDERPIILQASIDLKQARLSTNAATGGSWKDDEVSYSNVAGLESMKADLMKEVEELDGILGKARERLAQPKKHSLKGFENPPNIYEG